MTKQEKAEAKRLRRSMRDLRAFSGYARATFDVTSRERRMAKRMRPVALKEAVQKAGMRALAKHAPTVMAAALLAAVEPGPEAGAQSGEA